MTTKKSTIAARVVLSPFMFIFFVLALLLVAVLIALGVVALPFIATYLFVRDGMDAFTNLTSQNPDE